MAETEKSEKLEKATFQKLQRLVDALRETHLKEAELTEEISRLLNGETGIGDVLKLLERNLSEVWAVRYGSAYLWTYTKDRPQLKRLLKTLQPDQVCERWQAYLRSDDPYYKQARHGFGLFCSQINRFAPAGPDALSFDADAPTDCHHRPRCSTDIQHTKRRSDEWREHA